MDDEVVTDDDFLISTTRDLLTLYKPESLTDYQTCQILAKHTRLQ